MEEGDENVKRKQKPHSIFLSHISGNGILLVDAIFAGSFASIPLITMPILQATKTIIEKKNTSALIYTRSVGQ